MPCAIWRAPRAQRLKGKVIAVTGSVGKTSTKEALAARLVARRPHACLGRVLQQPLGRTAVARTLSARGALCGVRTRHESRRRNRPAVALVRPDVAIITTVAPVHLQYFKSVEEIADAKAEIFEGLQPGGIAILNRDNAQFDRLNDRARDARVARVVIIRRERSERGAAGSLRAAARNIRRCRRTSSATR